LTLTRRRGILFPGAGLRSCSWHKHGGRRPVNEEASVRRRLACRRTCHAAPTASAD
jgi:hypothetical protein